MRTIKIGSRGGDVQRWQHFLRGFQCGADGQCTAAEVADGIITDGVFGPATDKATKAWQKSQGLTADGVVGPNTWAEAVKDGFVPDGVPMGTGIDHDVDSDPPLEVKPPIVGVDKTSPKWPPCPEGHKPVTSNAARDILFGKILYVPAPTANNPEAIKITNDWAKANIAKFTIPQLSKSPISMHREVGPQFVAWFQAIEAKGLSDRILSFGGCWVPRYVRGSRKTLSNHSWAVAIDVNVPWNGRGRQSALVGAKGCVREIAEFCADFGLFWGGHYSGAPEDGMHFEANMVLSKEQLAQAKAKHGI